MTELGDLANLMGGITSGLLGEQQRVARNLVKGLVVSTVNTSDCGYETAILDTDHARPVERYDTWEDAVRGHARWKRRARTLKKVTMLGYGELVEPENFELQRGLTKEDL